VGPLRGAPAARGRSPHRLAEGGGRPDGRGGRLRGRRPGRDDPRRAGLHRPLSGLHAAVRGGAVAHQPGVAVHADGGAPAGRGGGRGGAAGGCGARRAERGDRCPADGGGAGRDGPGGRAGLEVVPGRAVPGRRARGAVPAAPGPGERIRVSEGAGPPVAASPAGHRRSGAFLAPPCVPPSEPPCGRPAGSPVPRSRRRPSAEGAERGPSPFRRPVSPVPEPRPLSVVSTVPSTQVAAHPHSYSSAPLSTGTHPCTPASGGRASGRARGAWAPVVGSGRAGGGG